MGNSITTTKDVFTFRTIDASVADIYIHEFIDPRPVGMTCFIMLVAEDTTGGFFPPAGNSRGEIIGLSVRWYPAGPTVSINYSARLFNQVTVTFSGVSNALMMSVNGGSSTAYYWTATVEKLIRIQEVLGA